VGSLKEALLGIRSSSDYDSTASDFIKGSMHSSAALLLDL
jgi:hypothetical protein